MADYAISNVPRRVVYAASGVGPYAFTFEILVNTDVAVYRDDTLLTLSTDYTVSIAANGTGTITLVATPTGATQIAIVGARAIQRTSDFVTGGDFFANTVNDELDSLTIFAQQNAEAVNRAMQAPQTDPIGIDMTLPRASERAGKYLSFDENGDPLAAEGRTEVAGVFAIRNEIQAVAAIDDEVVAVAGNATNVNTVAGISANVTTVAGISANVTTVAGNNANVTSVAGNATNINTVAGSISSVNTVGTNVASVNTVAGEIGAGQDVTVVAANLSGTDTIGTVATNIANVNAVGTNIANVNAVNSNATNINTVAGQITPTNRIQTVAGISAAITTVAGISSAVSTVATNNSNVSTVATNIANVNSVGGNIANVNSVAGNATNINAAVSNATNINTVATNIASVSSVSANISNVNAVNSNATNINSVAGNSTNINTVAGISANVTTVATNNANVTTVAGSIASVNTNATNIANINQNAANIVAIQNASANATAAAASATSASGSATAAAASAAAASAVVLGNEPVRPLVRPSLLLDFANTEQLDPRITFTRASTATYYGTQTAKAEENLLVRSQEFDNAAWSKSGGITVTANTTTAPDGTSTAETISESTSSGPRLVQSISGAITTAVLSGYYKNGDAQYCYLASRASSGNSAGSVFDLAAGTVVRTDSYGTVTATNATITAVGNGWHRCSVTISSSSGVVSYYTGTSDGTAVQSTGYTGHTGSSKFIYGWGFQAEARSAVTAYTPTTTQPITNYIPVLETAASGVARFDHNPTTGESLGLLIEEQRTNLLLRSEEFENAAWGKSNTTLTANTVASPNGTLTGGLLAENTANATHVIQQSFTFVASTTYTISVYVKAAGRTKFQFSSISGFSPGATFDLVAVTATTIASTTSATITPVGNGWFRCTATRTSTGGTDQAQIRLNDNAGNVIYTGDGYSGIYIWGAQLEAGAFPTSYIPTVASQVTRAADSASMTGANFSSWYNQAEGTLYAEAAAPLWGANDVASAPAMASINDGAANNRIYLGRSAASTRPFFNVNVAGVTQADITTSLTSWAGGSAMKLAGAYEVNDFAICTDGGAAGTDTVGTLPVVTQLLIGSRGDGPIWNSTIKKLAYYPARVTNAQLQAMTTV